MTATIDAAATELGELEREAIHSLLHRLETRWHDSFDSGPYHAWNPLPFWDFLDGVRAAEPYAHGRRFLDVGCGIGTKLALMHELGWDVSGIDRHEPYVEAARELMHERPRSVTHGDAFDFEVFDADLVYMYRPMKSEDDTDALEQHVARRLPAGAVLFLPTRDVRPLGLRVITAEIGVA